MSLVKRFVYWRWRKLTGCPVPCEDALVALACGRVNTCKHRLAKIRRSAYVVKGEQTR